MPGQLDILALEPFYGGARRAMLETISRQSRHRWTVLKLPPRRIERRLAVAATWFGEQLRQHWSGNVDLLFTSEALNLPDLLRQIPALARKPKIVYFHDNQLPHVQAEVEGPLDFVNMHTAQAADEVWFNSLFHRKTFEARLQALIFRHPEMEGRSPLPALLPNLRIVPPPVEHTLDEPPAADPGRRLSRIFVDTRDSDVKLFNSTAMTLYRRGERVEYVTVGPVSGIGEEITRRTLPEQDDTAHVQAYQSCGIVLSVRPGAYFDLHAIRGLVAGCVPLFPRRGFYPEILPAGLYDTSLYDDSPDRIASRIQDMLHAGRAVTDADAARSVAERFDAAAAVRQIDARLEEVVRTGTSPAR